MNEDRMDKTKSIIEQEADTLPEYIPPKIITYTSDEILEQIGPAMACISGDLGP